MSERDHYGKQRCGHGVPMETACPDCHAENLADRSTSMGEEPETTIVFLQPGYSGREISALLLVRDLFGLRFIRGTGPTTHLHVGSVEYVESVIGRRTPNFYPDWASDHFNRRLERRRAFVKSAEGYKDKDILKGDLWVSDVVEFVDEWRQYWADGKCLCSWWYQGNESTSCSDPHGPDPSLLSPPEGFCGAVDVGVFRDGTVALVEVQHPYAIGWYGDQEDSVKYVEFLRRGWLSLTGHEPFKAAKKT